TGYASFPSAIEALQAGVSDYLAKPSNIEQLKLAIVNALEKRRLGRALIQAERAEAARDAAERHAARLAVLSHAGVELGSTLEVDEALRRLAALAIPTLADW